MKTAFGILFLFVLTMSSAHAEQVWFALDPTDYPIPPDSVHYTTADEACRKAYADDVDENAGSTTITLLPYRAPTFDPYSAPVFSYTCETYWTSSLGGVTSFPHIIVLQGDSCASGLVLDVYAGKCETLEEFQARRQLGDPNDNPNNDPNDCQGNPINAALGNKFENELDYRDADGELVFRRYYNGLEGKWRNSYSASLVISPVSIMLTFDDGRASLFTLSSNVATAEPSERGNLVKAADSWIYSSPSNQTMTFDSTGRLIALKTGDGLIRSLSYGYDNDFNNQVTVTDSRGHTLNFSVDYDSALVKMIANGATVTYAYSDAKQLTTVTRALAGKATSRSYLYEDATHPFLLTGLVDERGIRAATWAYDAQGRAISSEHSGGADKTTITYADDGTTTVTNALGHLVTYKYALAGGTRRITSVKGEPAPGCPLSNSSFTYDDRGQIATKTDALGHVTSFTYDAQGRETVRTEAKGSPQERITTTAWDGASFRPKTVTAPDRAVTYSYDTQGRLLSTAVHSVKE